MRELAWTIALVPIIVLLGCGPSTDDVGRTVSLSMQEKFNSDAQLRDLHLTVQSVTVVHSSGNAYQGIAEVSSHGVTHEVMVKITASSFLSAFASIASSIPLTSSMLGTRGRCCGSFGVLTSAAGF